MTTTMRGSVPFPQSADASAVRVHAANLMRLSSLLTDVEETLADAVTMGLEGDWAGVAATAMHERTRDHRSAILDVAAALPDAADALNALAASIESTTACYEYGAAREAASEPDLPSTVAAYLGGLRDQTAAAGALQTAGAGCAARLLSVEARLGALQVEQLAEDATDWLGDTATNAWDWLGEAASDVWDWVDDVSSRVLGLPDSIPAPGDDRVVRTEIYELEGALGVLPVDIGGRATYQVDTLANGRVRVTEVFAAGAGLSAEGGAVVDVDLGRSDLDLGAGAGAGFLVGGQRGRTWEVAPSEVNGLLAGVAAERTTLPGMPTVANPLVIASRVSGLVPPPIRDAGDVSFDVEGNAAVGGLILGGEIEGEGQVARGGFVNGDGSVGVRYSRSGTLSGDLDVPLYELEGGTAPGLSAMRAESVEYVVSADGTRTDVTVERVVGSGSTRTIETTRYVLPRAELDPSSPFDVDRLGEPVSRTQAVATIDERQYGAGVVIGVPGVEADGELRFRRQTIDYRYPGQ